MAEASKKPESHKPHDPKEEHKGEHKPAAKEHKEPAHAKAEHKPEAKDTHAHKPGEVHKEQKLEGGKSEKKTGAGKKAAEAKSRAEGKSPKAAAKKASKEATKIVQKQAPKYVANPKPELTADQKLGLSQRRIIKDRRPWFRRQQWYEYKRLANSGWRKPTGVDSAQRRHFGYEQSVVRVGFGGPKSVRGLHSSGFQEVRVEQVKDLSAIDKKTQAARISGTLGARKLKLIYAEADKLGVHILNRRQLQ